MLFKIALMGYGHIGQIHEEAIKQVNNAQLVAIIDPIAQHSSLPVFKDLQSFTEENISTDLIAIATPNGYHSAHAIESLKAGFHVLIEKPICLCQEDLDEILEVSKIQNKRVFNMMQLRFSPVVQRINDVLQRRELGEVFMVNVQCYWNRNKEYYTQRQWHGNKELDGGVLFTQFSHFVDILSYWFTDLKVENSQSWNFSHNGITEFPDSGRIDFTSNSTQGHLIYSTATEPGNFESSITILAENGSLQVKGQYMNELSHFALKNSKKDLTFSTEQKKFHVNAYQHIIACIQNQKKGILDAESAKVPLQFMIDAS